MSNPSALCSFHRQAHWICQLNIEDIQSIQRPLYLGKETTFKIPDHHDSPIDDGPKSAFIKLTVTPRVMETLMKVINK
jgi:hypothetical protein